MHCDRERGRGSLNSNNILAFELQGFPSQPVIFPIIYLAVWTYFSAFSPHKRSCGVNDG